MSDAAFAELAAGIEPGDSTTTLVPSADLGTATLEELILNANTSYEQAQGYLRDGDWSGYGTEMDRLQTILTQLAQTTGIALPTTITETVPSTETIPLEAEPTATPQ